MILFLRNQIYRTWISGILLRIHTMKIRNLASPKIMGILKNSDTQFYGILISLHEKKN